MTETLKRPRGRPPLNGRAMTPQERNEARIKRGARRVLLAPDVMADIAAIQERDGDRNATQTVTRAVRRLRQAT